MNTIRPEDQNHVDRCMYNQLLHRENINIDRDCCSFLKRKRKKQEVERKKITKNQNGGV